MFCPPPRHTQVGKKTPPPTHTHTNGLLMLLSTTHGSLLLKSATSVLHHFSCKSSCRCFQKERDGEGGWTKKNGLSAQIFFFKWEKTLLLPNVFLLVSFSRRNKLLHWFLSMMSAQPKIPTFCFIFWACTNTCVNGALLGRVPEDTCRCECSESWAGTTCETRKTNF